MDMPSELDELVDKCDYDTRLAVTAWVIRNIVEHAEQGGSYRYLIYDRLGFSTDAYVPLYEAGGMTISNEFDLGRMEEIAKVVRQEKYDALKPYLNLCDEPGCYNTSTAGWPSPDGYRHTCYDHVDNTPVEKIADGLLNTLSK